MYFQLLRWLLCISNQREGVVALGEESPADRCREASWIPSYVRVKATTKCYLYTYLCSSCGRQGASGVHPRVFHYRLGICVSLLTAVAHSANESCSMSNWFAPLAKDILDSRNNAVPYLAGIGLGFPTRWRAWGGTAWLSGGRGSWGNAPHLPGTSPFRRARVCVYAQLVDRKKPIGRELMLAVEVTLRIVDRFRFVHIIYQYNCFNTYIYLIWSSTLTTHKIIS